MIPPPRLNSYTDDLLAPLPKEYMRTPSSDMEESGFTHNQSQADVELLRKVREQSIKVWGKKHKNKEEVDECSTKKCDDAMISREEERDDVFYTNTIHHKSGKGFFPKSF